MFDSSRTGGPDKCICLIISNIEFVYIYQKAKYKNRKFQKPKRIFSTCLSFFDNMNMPRNVAQQRHGGVHKARVRVLCFKTCHFYFLWLVIIPNCNPDPKKMNLSRKWLNTKVLFCHTLLCGILNILCVQPSYLISVFL